MKSIFHRRTILAMLLSITLCTTTGYGTQRAWAATQTIQLSCKSKKLSIGKSFSLLIKNLSGKIASFASSNANIATVNAQGQITAKKKGSCKITVTVGGRSTSCKVTVSKPKIKLNKSSISLENGQSFPLKATSSSANPVLFSSNKKSVAVVDEDGVITACKPGNAIITAKVDGVEKHCKVKVKLPSIKLNQLHTSMFRYERFQLTATVSSGVTPVWKSSKPSIAIVDETGMVTAIKHGTSLISASADGITKYSEVVVEVPKIKLSSKSIKLRAGQSKVLHISINSGNAPAITSSRPSVASVDLLGNITAKKAGTTTISVTEDGARATCKVKVTK